MEETYSRRESRLREEIELINSQSRQSLAQLETEKTALISQHNKNLQVRQYHTSVVVRQKKGATTSHINIQIDPFASEQLILLLKIIMRRTEPETNSFLSFSCCEAIMFHGMYFESLVIYIPDTS